MLHTKSCWGGGPRVFFVFFARILFARRFSQSWHQATTLLVILPERCRVCSGLLCCGFAALIEGAKKLVQYYQITGWIVVICFSLSLLGIAEQLRQICERRRRMMAIHESERSVEHRPTDVLSLNQFFASFLAFYSFLVYGLCLDPFNHFLVWTRLPAVILAVLILREIQIDRRDRSSTAVWRISLLMIAASLGLLVSDAKVSSEARWIASGLAVFAAGVFAQGLLHQVLRIRQTGRTGAISLRMHQLTTLKDASTVAFSFAIPDGNGWPLLLVGLVGMATKLALMWQFRWARRSSIAAARRDQSVA